LFFAVEAIQLCSSTNISSKNNAHQHRPKANVSTSVFLSIEEKITTALYRWQRRCGLGWMIALAWRSRTK
jgi:hypothetical protein